MTYAQFLDDLGNLLTQFRENMIAFIPKLVFAIFIILIGILVARLIQGLVNRFIKNLDRFILTKKLQSRLKHFRMDRSANLMAKIVFWIISQFFE